MTQIFGELEKLGIQFVPKVLKSGAIEDTYDRDRRLIVKSA